MKHLKDIIVKQETQYGKKGLTLQNRMAFKEEAKLALRMIETYGMVAVDKPFHVEDGSSITAKLLTPEQVVDRAFAIAELTMDKIIEKELYVELPDIEEDSFKENK